MRSLRRWVSTGVFLGLGMGGVFCTSPVEEPGSRVPGSCQSEAPLLAPQKTDILFVIDNSGSMSEEQDGLALELPTFIEELEKGGGAAHDFQVGVVTTSVYQNAQFPNGLEFKTFPAQSGRLQAVPLVGADGVTEQGTERLISSSDPELVEKFKRLVKQGTTGSGQETPFEAARLALIDLAGVPMAQGGNQGFLRDGARLLVVIVSDEDDCSEVARPPQVELGTQKGRNYCGEQSPKLESVQSYAEKFKALVDGTGAPRQVLWATIGPVGMNTKEAREVVEDGMVRNAECPTSFQPGFRQREMAAQFDPTLANLDSICRESYRDTLLSIAQLANVAQSLEVKNVPDPRLLKVELTRDGGEVQICTLANGDITFEEASGDVPSKVNFNQTCTRRASDQAVKVKMLCAG